MTERHVNHALPGDQCCSEEDCAWAFPPDEGYYCSICKRHVCYQHYKEIHQHCRGCAVELPPEGNPTDVRI